MAMTKKELAEVTTRIREAEIKAALRWTSPVLRDLPAPTSGANCIEGWDFNSSSMRVFKAWSESNVTGDGEHPTPEKRKSIWTASRGSRSLFSTEALAYKAMRHELECKFAKELYTVDEFIKARANE